MSSPLEPPRAGWLQPPTDSRYHYFVGGRSLCGGFATKLTDYQPEAQVPRPLLCKACLRNQAPGGHRPGKGE